MKHQLIMENWRNYLKEIDVTDPDTTRAISSPDLDLGKVKVSKEDFDNLRMVISLLDPTGISAWPDIPPAIEAFEKNPSVLNAADLTLALANAIPIYGKIAKGLQALNKLRKVNNSLKQVKGSKEIVGKINLTLKNAEKSIKKKALGRNKPFTIEPKKSKPFTIEPKPFAIEPKKSKPFTIEPKPFAIEPKRPKAFTFKIEPKLKNN